MGRIVDLKVANAKVKARSIPIKRERPNVVVRQKWLFECLVGKSCVDCGNSNPVVLQFDHRFEEKSFTIGMKIARLNEVSIDQIRKEIAKCEIRCSNCHVVRHAQERKTYRFVYWKQWLEGLYKPLKKVIR